MLNYIGSLWLVDSSVCMSYKHYIKCFCWFRHFLVECGMIWVHNAGLEFNADSKFISYKRLIHMADRVLSKKPMSHSDNLPIQNELGNI